MPKIERLGQRDRSTVRGRIGTSDRTRKNGIKNSRDDPEGSTKQPHTSLAGQAIQIPGEETEHFREILSSFDGLERSPKFREDETF
jgi:hypothetical protein